MAMANSPLLEDTGVNRILFEKNDPAGKKSYS